MSRLVILLVLVCVTLVSAASRMPKCVDDHITKIKEYWAKNGVPKGIINSKDRYIVVSDTDTALAHEGRCQHFTFSPPTGNSKAFRIIIQETNEEFPVTESDGVLSIMDGADLVTSFVIAFLNELLVTYKCSKDGPDVTTVGGPYVAIAATPKNKQEDVRAMEATLKGMGFNMTSFGCI